MRQDTEAEFRITHPSHLGGGCKFGIHASIKQGKSSRFGDKMCRTEKELRDEFERFILDLRLAGISSGE